MTMCTGSRSVERRAWRAAAARVVVVAVVLLGGSLRWEPSGAAPPEETHEVVISPTVVEPGDVISFDGLCWSSVFQGPGDGVLPRGARRVTSASPLAFDFTGERVRVGVSGGYRGVLLVPSDAPPGVYRFRALCSVDDQVLGTAEAEFTVVGDLPTDPTPPSVPPAVVTTAPASSAPTGARPGPREAAGAAVAVETAAGFTG